MAQKIANQRLPPIAGSRAVDQNFGPTYQLSGSNVKYNLPQPNALKPYVDTRAGEMDTWPAHASSQALAGGVSASLNKNKQLVLVNEEDMGKAQIIPKPRFLDQLEVFLKKELQSLGITRVEPSELRLQAHREVFEYLIEDFKTYKPLLSSIKNEYEMMVAFQRDTIRQLEPLKQMLVTVSEQCDQKIMQQRDTEKQEIADLKKENQNLYKRIDSMRNEQKSLESTVEKLKQDIKFEYDRYREMADSRKLLISEVNELKAQQEDYIMSQNAQKGLGEPEDDPVTLKIALRKARADHNIVTQKLIEIEANYADVVARPVWVKLDADHRQLQEEYESLLKEKEHIFTEHEELKELYEKVVEQRDQFFNECEELRRTGTPRPDWVRCADTIHGGGSRWRDISEGKTSDELVDVLLQEIQSGEPADAGGLENFEAMGTGDEVPVYLRAEGSIRNRRLSKRDCLLLIQDIWREKTAHDQERTDGKREEMAEFLSIYLKRRFPTEKMVLEWAYNLYDACQRFMHEDTVSYFLGVVNGEQDEEIYYAEMDVVYNLQTFLTKIDIDAGNEGLLSKDEFLLNLSDHFSKKDDEAIEALIRVAEIQLDAKDADAIQYKELFMEDDEGHTGKFVEEIKRQIKAERVQYVEEIKLELGDGNEVTPNDLRAAIIANDPQIDQAHMASYLSWTYNKEYDHMEEAEPMLMDDLIVRLCNGNVKRVGMKF